MALTLKSTGSLWSDRARADSGYRNRPLTRRGMLRVAACSVFMPVLGAHAQQATPNAALGLDAYPELRVRATDDALESPAEVPAGRYMLILENAGSGLAGAYPLERPAGMSAAEMQAGIQEAISTPDGRVPDWFYETRAVGGPFAAPGVENRVIVDLATGSYGILNSGTGMVVPLEVVAGDSATPPEATEPNVDLEIEMLEHGYVGLPEEVAPGPQVWSVTTTGAQPHELALLQAPDGTSFEDVMVVLTTPPDATPVSGELTFMDLMPVGGVGYLSPGHTAWGVFNLAPGTYVALCFVPDRETGMPHAAMGMISVFTISDSGSDVPGTPAG